jgi:hypothetical protein
MPHGRKFSDEDQAAIEQARTARELRETVIMMHALIGPLLAERRLARRGVLARLPSS